MEWVRRIFHALATLALLGAIVFLVTRASVRAARRVWVCVFAVVVGGGITMMDAHAFIAKWAFKGDSPRDGLISMMDGTAHRPFVYRRLAPDIVRIVTSLALEHAPAGAVDRLVVDSPLKRYRLTWIDDRDWSSRKAVAFHVAYALVWICLFGTLLSGAALIHVVRGSSAFESILTASVAMSLLPLALVGGGYLYDAPELFLWTSLLGVTIAGPMALTVPLFALMLVNKESALLGVPALSAFLLDRFGPRRAAAWTAFFSAIGLAWVWYVRSRFAALPGGVLEWWLPSNLEFWAYPKSYLQFAQLHSPALVSPRGANVLTLVLLLFPLRFGWWAVTPALRRATFMTGVLLAPFFLALGYRDELRALSLLFPLLFVVAVEGCHRMLKAESP